MLSARPSFWKVFRIIFVILFLYLIGDAFYRWDGFKLYGSLSEFTDSLCLVIILWSIIALIFTAILWFPFKIISLFSEKSKWSITDRSIFFVCFVFFLTIAIKIIKRQVFTHAEVSTEFQVILLMGGVLISLILTFAIERLSIRESLSSKYKILQYTYILFLLLSFAWIYKRIKFTTGTHISWPWLILLFLALTLAGICISWLIRKYDIAIQERITPLVWLFALFVIISFAIAGYKLMPGHLKKETHFEHDVSSLSDKNGANIILLTFDALSARDMSTYGYHRQTTPYITEWAKKAVLFNRAKASGNWTTTTTTSLMTGKRVWTHRVFQPHGFNIDKGDTENLLTLLEQNDYYIMGYIASEWASPSRTGLAKYYDVSYTPVVFMENMTIIARLNEMLAKYFADRFILYDWILKEDFIFRKFVTVIYRDLFKQIEFLSLYDMKKVFDKFFEDIDHKLRKPFFAWIHIYQPHNPYNPPEHLRGKFGKITDDPDEIDRSRDRYDELILYCNENFEHFINELAEKKLLENTVIILSADHGEMFEDYKVGHGGQYLNEAVVSIPLIIKDSDTEKGKVIDDLVEQVDIPATILDLAGVPVPSWMEGRSLVPLMRGERLAQRPAFSMNFEKNPGLGHPITAGSIAVWEGDYKMIHNLERKESMLFNLNKDPGELNNIFDREPEISRRLIKLLNEKLQDANNKIGHN